jgi:bacterioferritin-associated ferredoxin
MGGSPTGPVMIICSCNVITDQDVRSVIDSESPPRTAEVYTCLGCSARCGRCARTIKRIMADAIKGCPADCRCGGCRYHHLCTS